MTDNPGPDGAVDRVADLLGRRIGLRPQSSAAGRLRRCVRDQAAARGADVDAYVDQLAVDNDAYQRLVNQVTVQESGFFRHPQHFAVLARDILPRLTAPITIWSAGCGNGQEPFSLAMALEELRLEGSVVATDLSTAGLRRTAAGIYSGRELGGLSPERISRHMSPAGDNWKINDNIQARVTTSHHNLIDGIPERVRSCQVLFCRNVLIYFATEHSSAFLDRVAAEMPETVLFLGSAETLWSVSDRFEAVRTDDAYYYRPKAAARRPPGGHHTAEPAERSPRGSTTTTLRQATAAGPLGSDGSDRLRKPLGQTARPSRPGTVHPPQESAPSPSPGPSVISPKVVRDDRDAAELTRSGQYALAAGNHRAAVVAFRKCAYLRPDDALAHLHLGLAFEVSGDVTSARRAFSTARRTLLTAGPAAVEYPTTGYSAGDLLRFLDSKTEGLVQ